MLEETYKRMTDQLTPDPVLLRRTLAMARREERPARPRRKRLIAVALAAALCAALLTIPALAAGAYELAYSLSPAVAQRFKPVNLSCEDNGIRMEVLSVRVEGDMAAVYIVMEDLTGGRIDGTIDLLDSADIRTAFDSAVNCRLVSYDEQAGAATFLITMTQFDGKAVEGSKMTFSVSRFMSRKRESAGAVMMFGELPESGHETQKIRDGETITVLAPEGVSWTPLDAEGISVTAVGYVDGLLHIQLHCENIRETDNHGNVYFLDGGGEKINGETLSFWDEAGTGCYYEFIFDIAPEELAGKTLYGHFVTCGTLTEGHWEVTFPLEN